MPDTITYAFFDAGNSAGKCVAYGVKGSVD